MGFSDAEESDICSLIEAEVVRDEAGEYTGLSLVRFAARFERLKSKEEMSYIDVDYERIIQVGDLVHSSRGEIDC
jgi:sporulation protein YlmC with PRC-barrel domain